MSDTYAVQHAKEIFKTAQETDTLNKWQSDLRILAELGRDAVLAASLQNPSTSVDEKAKLLAERLGEANPAVLKLVTGLIDKGRLFEIDDISYEYQKLLDTHRGIEGTETAEITTAVALDDDYVLSIGKRLTEMAGKPVVVTTKVDPAIVGGVVIKVGDKVIDGSIRSKLSVLKRELGRAVR